MSDAISDRVERYRARGWWTGERLVDRYAGDVQADGDCTAVIAGDVALTRGELWDSATDLAEELRGAAGGDHGIALIRLPNGASWMTAFVASMRAGLVPATLPTTTTPDHVRHVIDLVAPAVSIDTAGVTARDSWAPAPDEIAHLMFTSSTTGAPKAVAHTEDTLATLNRQFAERFELSAQTAIFMPSPLGHSVGAIHGARLALWLGAPLVLQSEWSPTEALELVDRHRAQFAAAATPFLVDLIEAEWAGPKLAPLR